MPNHAFKLTAAAIFPSRGLEVVAGGCGSLTQPLASGEANGGRSKAALTGPLDTLPCALFRSRVSRRFRVARRGHCDRPCRPSAGRLFLFLCPGAGGGLVLRRFRALGGAVRDRPV